jgi:hypothetical protein
VKSWQFGITLRESAIKKASKDKVEVEPGADKRLANILKKALNTPPSRDAGSQHQPKADSIRSGAQKFEVPMSVHHVLIAIATGVGVWVLPGIVSYGIFRPYADTLKGKVLVNVAAFPVLFAMLGPMIYEERPKHGEVEHLLRAGGRSVPLCRAPAS